MFRPLSTLLALLTTIAPSAGQEILDAAKHGDLDRVQALLARDPEAPSAVDHRGCTPLHLAVSGNHRAVVLTLLEAGADIEARDIDGDTALHWAACTDHLGMIDLLVELGAEVDAQNHHEETPLLYATRRLKYAVVERLVQRGADLELPNDYGRTPMIYTAREGGNLRMARLLLRLGADPNAQDRYQDTALSLAAWRGFRELVDLLLESGARTDLRPGMSQELLLYSGRKGLDRLYRRLLEEGAKVDITPGLYTSALHIAAGGGSPAIVRDLLKRGATTRAVDLYGWTPLHHAADRGRSEVISELLAGSSGEESRTLSGHSPLSLARSGGSAAAVAVLEGAGHTAAERVFPELVGNFLGQGEPPPEPEPFAPDIVATCWGEHGSVSFSPDGREAFWSGSLAIPDSGYATGTILTSRVSNGLWTPPERASFTVDWEDDVPFVAPDGGRVFFLSLRPLVPGGQRAERVWVVERESEGWGDPRPLPQCVNEMPHHWQISVAANGNLYFSSRRSGPETDGIYVSRRVDEIYTEPEYLGFRGSTPFISPDESYLITLENRQVGNVIRFRLPDGSWGQPLEVASVRPGVGGICPKISPDGRAFFYISQHTGANNNCWVEASFLEELRDLAAR